MIDVDGVVVRGRPSDGRAWHADLFADLGVRYDDLQREFFSIHWRDVTLGRAALRARLQPALAAIAPGVGVDDLIDYWHSNDSALDGAVIDAVDRARHAGLKSVLVTNQDHDRSRYLWREVGLERYFDDMIYSAALGFRKPEPGFYRAAAKRTALPPEAHLLVDDSEENVLAAQAEGWNAAKWERGSDLDALLSVLAAG
ncbi:MAG: HAD-IA family hydrolase [Alphaproteobacteria bacterium]|nr:HAD-IA family hydrolase [Alphaproteobacteria bacterium]MBV9371458.1 HAD-IA family hydrolase [Alphaproteobacteria bacterium]MBV9902395.1 HAD-IA family hydrolase [Alphaproteobacteria bacterium]